MTEIIKDLDAAVTGESDGTTSAFADEYPDAPAWAVELAGQIEANEAQLRELERSKEKQRAAWQHELKESIESLEKRSAVVAANAGVATSDERSDVLEAETETDDDVELSARQSFFIPENEKEYQK